MKAAPDEIAEMLNELNWKSAGWRALDLANTRAAVLDGTQHALVVVLDRVAYGPWGKALTHGATLYAVTKRLLPPAPFAWEGQDPATSPNWHAVREWKVEDPHIAGLKVRGFLAPFRDAILSSLATATTPEC